MSFEFKTVPPAFQYLANMIPDFGPIPQSSENKTRPDLPYHTLPHPPRIPVTLYDLQIGPSRRFLNSQKHSPYLVDITSIPHVPGVCQKLLINNVALSFSQICHSHRQDTPLNQLQAVEERLERKNGHIMITDFREQVFSKCF